MIVPMRRVDVVTPRGTAGRALRAIHRAGLLHLAPYEPPPGLGPAVFAVEPGAGVTSRIDRAVERIAELADLLGPARAPTDLVASGWEFPDEAILARAAAFDPVRERAAALTAERVRLGGEIARLEGYQRLVGALRSIVGRLPTVRGYGSTGIVIAARYRAVVPLIREELEAVTEGRCEVIAADLGADRVAAILLYPVRLGAEVGALLGGRDLEEVTLPEELAGVPFDELEPRLAAERDRLEERRASAAAELAGLARDHGPAVAALRLVLGDRVAESRALRDAATSDHLAVVGGWLPERDVEAFRAALERELGPAILVVERDVPPTGEPAAPVVYEHGRLVRAFAPVASFVALPRYGTIDPTPIVALTFPAFVGLMVGDAGYGLVALALLLLARRRWRDRPAMTILWPIGALVAISTILFGILFGEWFGEVGHRFLGLQPLWLDRRTAVRELLVLAFAIGLAQVGLGLILGIANAALLRHRRAVAGRVALFVGFLALLAFAGAVAHMLPGEVAPVSVATLIVAFLVLVATIGLAGPIEVVGVVGNVLSYARLMAIGLSSVMLAVVANRLGGLIESAVIGVFVAGVLHALNLVLGFFDASVQGLRLHYVEFFGRFLEPGGVRYEPFVSVLDGGAHSSARPSQGGP